MFGIWGFSKSVIEMMVFEILVFGLDMFGIFFLVSISNRRLVISPSMTCAVSPTGAIGI